MTHEPYIYHLTEQERFLSQHDVQQATDIFGTASDEFHETMLARQKAWANLIARDWDRAVQLKPRLQDYPDAHTAHEAACNAVAMRHNKLDRFKRQEASKGRKAAKKKVKPE